jgi:hypothetical protein
MNMTTSMGWDNVSELWSPTGLLFIPLVIHGHGEPWWNDAESGKLSGDPAVRLISSKAVGIGEEHYECDFTKYLCSYFEGIFNMP